MQLVVLARWSPRWLFAQNEWRDVGINGDRREAAAVTKTQQVAEKGGKSEGKAEERRRKQFARTCPLLKKGYIN